MTIFTSRVQSPILNFPTFFILPVILMLSFLSILLWEILSSFAFFVYLSRTNIVKIAAVNVTRNDANTIDKNTLRRFSFFEINTSSIKSPIKNSNENFLVLLGTGWGLTEELLLNADYVFAKA